MLEKMLWVSFLRKKMDPEIVRETARVLRVEISGLRRDMDDLQNDWLELRMWVQNGVDMNEANARHTELTRKQDEIYVRLADVYRRIADLLEVA